MPVTYIDIESRSACDLKKCGQYVYAAHPTTEITIVARAVDGGPVSIWLPPRYNWNPAPSVIQHEGYTVHVGGAIPADLLASLDHDPMAHNASFERIMLSGPPGRRLGFPADLQRVARWDCTAARGAAVGLPRTLAGACGALGLAVQKDKDGHALMLKMCKPRKPRKAEVAANELLGGPMPLLWVDDFASMLREAVYCARDVEAERAIDRVIPRLRPEERETWECTEEANDHGAPVDVALLGAMLRVIDGAEERINGQISTRTGGVVPKVSDHGALTKWLVAQGIDDAKESGVGKQAIAAMIENEAEDSLVREVLAMRRDGGGVSPKKWRAILSRLSDDGRLRGSLVYGGAASTLRWSSRGAQLHNLPRGGSVKNVDAAVRDVVAGVDLDTIAERHGPPLVVASELLRPAFCAPDGFWVARGDYSQIEARVNPWLAGATWKLDAFRRYDDGTGPDLYKVSASGIYRVAVADVTKDQRQIGKVCLGASTKVLTQRGYVPIVSVTDTDLLWDGESWIKHSGLIFQGVKEVINWLGVTITPDHQLLSGDAWITARTASLCENTTRLVLERGSANLPLLATEPALKAVFLLCGSAVRAALQNILSAKQTFAGVRAPVAPDAPGNSLLRGARIIGVTRTSAQIPRIVGDCLTAYLRALRGANQVMTRGTNTTESGVFAFTSRGSAAKKANALFSRILSRCLGGTCRNSNWTGSRQTETTNPETCGSFLEAKTWRTGDKSQKCSSASPILKPVYDITNAGPNRRFTVLTDGGPVIVHNCELALGFQGGKGAFQAMARGYGVKVSDEQADEIKLAWRAANPEVVGFWRGLNSAAIECMRRPIGEQVDVWTLDSEWKPWHRTPLFFKRSRAALGLRLPSGRSICYWTPQLRDVDTPWGRRPAVLYYSEDSVTKQWRQFTAYGGILCENAVQATARDVMAFAWRNARSAGMRPFLSVHDELICLLPKTREAAGGGNHPFYPTAEEASQAVESIMRQAPPWARGLPIAADSSAGPRYVKA